MPARYVAGETGRVKKTRHVAKTRAGGGQGGCMMARPRRRHLVRADVIVVVILLVPVVSDVHV